MSSGIVVATQSTTIFVDAQRVHVVHGSAWAADSPVVRLHPDLFSDDPRRALGLDIVPPANEYPADAPVEQKTAAPGEKANVRRRAGIFGRG